MLEITFVEFDSIFLEKSYVWLHNPLIKTLTMTPDFTQNSQKLWYKKIKDSTNYLIWGIKANAEMIGACGLKNINQKTGEYWGYIGENSYWGLGIGKEMVKFTERQAKSLKLESVYLRVSVNNARAIGLYHRMGYKDTKSIDKIIFMEKKL